ncbi:hypothetical protein BC332_02988 [Capsicum chinense]|uniref:Uncharacterized protein n=1 Tax=Capsicum annuum TaxID=4072 RepID=A0A2G3ALY1_CAPAN|nr:uncharacterized protein LOC107854940 isoform X2 [Capsicum annuum]PHT95220.1 hypothetical protein T459_03102 [Capsicum annuum]PHU30895.1 hypothetical protein BC332_02988 [Capsicum chinense]
MASIYNNQKIILLLIFSLVFLSSPGVLAKSRRPISDAEISQKKLQCYADIESGMWGEKCKATAVDKENCALQCLSPVCFEHVYQSDPLEEGEKDLVRSQEYKYCMHKHSLGQSLDDIRGSFEW